MKNRSVSLPLVVLVAVVALVIGSLGTATAAGLTKGKVRAIAAKVVKKKAPKLSVANADNATNLAGQPASTYLDRFVQTTSTTSTAVAAGTSTQILDPVAITVPPGVGFVHVTAVAAFATGASNVSVWFQVDGVCTGSGDGFNNRQFGNTTNQVSVSLNRVVSVTPGVHTFRLCIANAANVNADNRALTVETVALAG